ncbi:hypothetical protein JKP88DRAFT_243613 [Tribonema minus]|uniref:RGS domain-containing protein n=1 Tax=Tribonema minus TaxID=303371 RepID=A0A835ZAM1_9STRA|nr:hypothetical protein JKP88DRAFT_243613 [Tribonema minus]
MRNIPAAVALGVYLIIVEVIIAALMHRSYFLPTLLLIPMYLKAARVIIVTSEEYRQKFMFMVTPGNQVAFSVGASVGCTFLAAIAHSTPAAKHTDRWVWVGVLVAFTVTAIIMVRELHRINDRLGLGREVTRYAASFYVFLGPYWLFLALDDYGVVHVDTRLQFLIIGLYHMLMLDTFVLSRKYWGRSTLAAPPYRWPFKSKVVPAKRCSVIPSEGSTSINEDKEQAAWEMCRRRWSTSLQMLDSPPLATAYSKYVQQALCFESFAFLANVVRYANDDYADTGQQYEEFESIVADFIVPKSRFEINISSTLRNQVRTTLLVLFDFRVPMGHEKRTHTGLHSALKMRDRAVFCALSEGSRRDVFKAQATEVAHMLDQNLMLSFQTTPAFRAACLVQQQLDNEEKLLSTIEEGGKNTPLPSPASSLRARSHLIRFTSRLLAPDGSVLAATPRQDAGCAAPGDASPGGGHSSVGALSGSYVGCPLASSCCALVAGHRAEASSGAASGACLGSSVAASARQGLLGATGTSPVASPPQSLESVGPMPCGEGDVYTNATPSSDEHRGSAARPPDRVVLAPLRRPDGSSDLMPPEQGVGAAAGAAEPASVASEVPLGQAWFSHALRGSDGSSDSTHASQQQYACSPGGGQGGGLHSNAPHGSTVLGEVLVASGTAAPSAHVPPLPGQVEHHHAGPPPADDSEVVSFRASLL